MSLASDYGLATSATQGAHLVLAATAGLASVAHLRTLQVAVGPLYVLFQAANAVGVASLVRQAQRSPGTLSRSVLRLQTGLVATSLLYLLALVLGGHFVGPLLLGQIWYSAEVLLLPFSVFVLSEALLLTSRAALRAIGDAKYVMITRALALPTILLAVIVGSRLAGGMGGVSGLALGNCAAALLCASLVRRRLHDWAR